MNRKRVTLLFMILMMTVSGCTGKTHNSLKIEFQSPEELLNEAHQSFEEESRIPVIGGDSSNIMTDTAGKINLKNKEEMDLRLCVTEDFSDDIEEAATMMHAMNPNIFTSAVFRIRKKTDALEFADGIEQNAVNKQWLDGMPEQIFIADVGNRYIVMAFGDEKLVQDFKANILSRFQGNEILVDEMIR